MYKKIENAVPTIKQATNIHSYPVVELIVDKLTPTKCFYYFDNCPLILNYKL